MKKLNEVGNLWRPYDDVSASMQQYVYYFTTSSGTKFEIKYDGAQVDPIDIVELFHAGDPEWSERHPEAVDSALVKGAEWMDKLRAAQNDFPHIIMYSLTFALLTYDDNGEIDYTFTATNKGGRDALEVLATVQKSIGDFLEECDDVDAIEFSADSDEKSRQKLYNHLASTLQTHLGWQLMQGKGWGCIEYVVFDPECLN